MTDFLDGKTAMRIYESTGRLSVEIMQIDQAPRPEGWTIFDGEPPKAPLNLDFAAASVQRIAPWISEAWIIPRLKDKTGEPWGGCYNSATGRIFMTYHARRGPSFQSVVYHEIFHAVQPRIDSEYRQKFYKILWNRTRYHHDPDYSDTGSETSARLFEAFANFLDEGGISTTTNGSDEITKFLGEVYSGQFAAECAELDRRQADADRRRRRFAEGKARLAGLIGFSPAEKIFS